MGVVGVVYWVYGVFFCVYAKCTIGEDAELGGVMVKFE